MKRFTLILIPIMALVAMMVAPVTAAEGSPTAALSSYTTTGAPGAGFVGGLIFLMIFAGVLTYLCMAADKAERK